MSAFQESREVMQDGNHDLALVNPADLFRVATNVAGVCGEIVKKTAVEIQRKKYVRVEGWEAIAAAHGCFAGADSAERAYSASGEHIGYQAKGYIRNGNGQVIGTGEGFVGFDETDRNGKPTWKDRAEYAGRAMAQTRAISRAARSVFAHVVVLIDSGLSTTPAEEVPAGGFQDDGERQPDKIVELDNPTKWQEVVLHFSKNKGRRLDELNSKQLHWYAHDWLDGKVQKIAKGERASTEDQELINWLMKYRREHEAFKASRVAAQPDESDQIPMAEEPF